MHFLLEKREESEELASPHRAPIRDRPARVVCVLTPQLSVLRRLSVYSELTRVLVAGTASGGDERGPRHEREGAETVGTERSG